MVIGESAFKKLDRCTSFLLAKICKPTWTKTTKFQVQKATHWIAVAWDNNLDENLVRDWMKKVPEINTAIKEHLVNYYS